jgi:hypothetical protein
LRPGSAIRQRRAVTHAPTPKKKITNPGKTSSRRKSASPIINQITSGFERIDVLIFIFLRLWWDVLIVYSKDM